MSLPKQWIECDNCMVFTGNEDDGGYWCDWKDRCPGKQEDLQLKEKYCEKKRLSKIINLIGHKKFHPGRLRGKLVDTVLKKKLLTGRYLFDNKGNLYFLELGSKRHNNISFEDITYIEESSYV